MIMIAISFYSVHTLCSLSRYSIEVPKHLDRAKSLHFDGPSNDVWNRFYGDETVDTYINQSKTVTENNNVFVDYVRFEFFHKNSVIRIEQPTTDTRLLVSTSSFFKSTPTENGGNIYQNAGSCVQYKICCIESKRKEISGTHSLIKVTNDENHTNFILESSITQNKGLDSILDHYYGEILFSSLNITDSKLETNAVFNSFQPHSHSITNFSNFKNISASRECCFVFFSKEQNFTFCNLIDNVVKRNNDALFQHVSATLIVSHCFFQGNKVTNIIYSHFGTHSVVQCHFDVNNTFSTDDDYINNSLSMTELTIPNLYSSDYCMPEKILTNMLEDDHQVYLHARRRLF